MSLKLSKKKRDVIANSIKKLSASIEIYINESNFEKLFPLRELILGKYNTIKEHINEILNLMEEEDDFEQEQDLQTNFAIYFKKTVIFDK